MSIISKTPPQPTVADVDALVDENGSRIELPEDSELKVAGEHDLVVGATSPTNWWLYGLIALAIVFGIVWGLQGLNGAPGSDMEPGTPTSAPVTTPATP